MAWLFSKRHQDGLSSGKVRVSLPATARTRLWALLKKHNLEWEDQRPSGFQDWTSILDELPKEIERELGLKELYSYPIDGGQTPKPGDLESFVLRGKGPRFVLDVVEMFYRLLWDDKRSPFQSEFNQMMTECNLPWKMAEGQIFLVDSEFFEESVLRQAAQLLGEATFRGALDEFSRARDGLANGDTRTAVQYSSHAVESVAKSLLGVGNERQRNLWKKLINSGIIPEYLDGFLESFKNIVSAPTGIRNSEEGAGHGQGREINEIPREIAELSVNLSGAMILFLMQRYFEANPQEQVRSGNSSQDDAENLDEVPF